jgi:hypothetical protein
MEEEEEINTNTIKDLTKKESINLNSLPMICLVEIAGFIDTDKKCLIYRKISKKFNEAIQMKLFMKANNDDAHFYKKCFMVLNTKCYKYYKNNIYPYLLNADTLYDFFNFYSEEVFNKLFNYCFNELKSIIISNKLKLNENNLEKTFRKTLIRFLITMTLKNFEQQEYDSLNFSELVPYSDAKEMIVLLVKLMKQLNYLDLSYIKINDNEFLSKLIDKIESKDKFTLLLEGLSLDSDLVKKIRMITDKSFDIKIKIDKKYNGQINHLGGKKMNKSKNLNKKKFKNLEFIK